MNYTFESEKIKSCADCPIQIVYEEFLGTNIHRHCKLNTDIKCDVKNIPQDCPITETCEKKISSLDELERIFNG